MKFEASVKEILPRTSSITSFRFARPAEFSYKPGQYMIVTIKSGAKDLMHPFSISSSPTEKYWIEFTKKFTNSEFSTALKAFKPGDIAMIDAPYGKFTFEGEYPKICLLTGGIGITPFRSMGKYCTDMRLGTDVVLLYGCLNPSEIAFKNELDEMCLQNKNLRVVFTVNEADDDWNGSVGNITVDMVKKEIPDYKERVFYACGPPGMVQSMAKNIKELGLPSTRLKLESFAGYE
jgi:ferredoxin-NADP reductase